MSCSVCHREIKVVARGLCNACYQRWQKRGTTDYAPQRVRGICSVKGCGKPHAARGLCDLHHQRLLNTGDPEKTKRPDDWGAKVNHPLYHRWYNMVRYRGVYPVAEEWCDFLTFVADIGEPPKYAKIFAADDTRPIGPQNYVLKRSITERAEGEDEATYQRRRSKAYRRVSKERYQDYARKKNYGLTPGEFDAMRDAQNGACAICKEPGPLCVDHCHDTGAVRGLLCHMCNRGLGLFKDSEKRLQEAIEYLAKGRTSVKE